MRTAASASLLTTLLAAMALVAACTEKTDPLPPPGTIHGTVVHRYSQRAVAGARVSCGGVTTTTDTRGAFDLRYVPQGERELVTAADGFHEDRLALDVGEYQTVNPVLFPVDTLADISGLVFHREDGPQPAAVTIGDTTLYADTEGRYELASVPLGGHLVVVANENYLPYAETLVVHGDGQVLLHRLLVERTIQRILLPDASIHWDEDDEPGNNHGTGPTVNLDDDPRRSGIFGFPFAALPDSARVLAARLHLHAEVPMLSLSTRFVFQSTAVSVVWYEESIDHVNVPDRFVYGPPDTVRVPAFVDEIVFSIDLTRAFVRSPTREVHGVMLDPVSSPFPRLQVIAKESWEPSLMPRVEVTYRY